MNFGILSTLWKRFWQTQGSNGSSDGDLNNHPLCCLGRNAASFVTETTTTNSFDEYSALNDKLLHHIVNGESETPECEAVRDQMDTLWNKMSLPQQDAIRKHNETALGCNRDRTTDCG